MSNKKNAGVSYKHVTPALVNQIKAVVADAATHNYSVSKVYGAYNAALQKNDKPQTCPSCLKGRVRDLKKWYADYVKATKPKEGEEENGTDEEPLTGEAALEALKAHYKSRGLDGDSPEEHLAEALKDFLADDTVVLSDEDRATFSGHLVAYEATVTDNATKAALAAEQDAAANLTNQTVNTDGALRLAEEGVQGIVFTKSDDDPAKGTVTWVDGSNVKPGKYALKDGRELAVQVGGKATIKEEDLT